MNYPLMPSPPLPLLGYCQLSATLADSPLQPPAAEAHGLLTGLLCAGKSAAGQAWIQELFLEAEDSRQPDAETCQALQAMADWTWEALRAPDLRNFLLLPEDEQPLRERALALYDWVRGLVFGLGIAGVRWERLSAQSREIFGDMAAITHMDLDALDESEENEAALLELQEFVRIATLLVFEECGRQEVADVSG